ncbi:MAG: hypothetical protein FWE53_02795 [Firmicutes bacterium]|nr:hypothetical protein [Bacillota bacterium]
MQNKTSNKNKYSLGKLAGTNPASVCYALEKQGIAPLNIKNILMREYALGEGAADMLLALLDNQKFVVRNNKHISLDLTFPENEPGHVQDIYVNSLIEELKTARKLITAKSFLVEAVRINKGAMLLPGKSLRALLTECGFSGAEISIDTGNYKLLTQEKLDILCACRVNWIGFDINSFNAGTKGGTDLNSFLKIYKQCLNPGLKLHLNFKKGMGSEVWQDFANSLAYLAEFMPHSVSIGTYARQKYTDARTQELVRVMWRTHEFLTEKAYKPYTIYAEKTNPQVLNMSYCQAKEQNKFNVFANKGQSTIIGCGVGAKTMLPDGLSGEVKVYQNTADLSEYVFDINGVLRKKNEFF